MQAALRKAQSRCKSLDGELAKVQRQQRKEETACTANGRNDGGASSLDDLQARSDELAAELATAKHQQLEAAAATAAAVAESRELRHQVERLQQQLADAGQQVAAPAATSDASSPGGLPEPAPWDGTPPARLQQQLADRSAALEQLEFERAELLVKLEESERQLAALTAAAASTGAKQAAEGEQQLPAAASATGKSGEPMAGETSSDSSEAGWRLVAAHASTDAAVAGAQEPSEALLEAQHRESELQQQVRQLEERVAQLDSQAAALQAELAAAGAAAAGEAGADAANLRRQLQERCQEVADLSALSIKADATVQQYMAQLRK